jgi:TonB family protein
VELFIRGQIHRSVRILALTLCAWPLDALAAAEPLVMAPSSSWVMDYAADSCALRRTFQSGDQKALLEFRRYGPGDHFEVLVVSDTVPRKERSPRVRFEPDTDWHEPAGARLASNSAGSGVLFQDSIRPRRSAVAEWSEPERDARERAIIALTVADSFERTLTLQTGAMQRPMAAMRTCVQDLVSPTGADEGPPGPVARGPAPVDLPDWARRIQEYYPPRMMLMGKGARISVRLVVGKDGKARSCFADGSHEQDFLDTACVALMQFARFEPAIDASGEPAIGTYSTTIVYAVN